LSQRERERERQRDGLQGPLQDAALSHFSRGVEEEEEEEEEEESLFRADAVN